MNTREQYFRKVYRDFQPKILCYLKRLAGESEAEDLIQEVFLRASKAIKNFEGRSQISTWLYRIATNVAIDRFRSPYFKRSLQEGSSRISRSEIVEEVEDKDIETEQKPPSAEAVLIREEMWECIREFVDRLPVNYRTVFVLSDLEGLQNNEIAEILGISLATVKIRLHHGRAKLRKEFETHCGLYRDARNGLAWNGKRP